MVATGGNNNAEKGKQKVKKVKPSLEPGITAPGDHGPSMFARTLGSVDYGTRERGVQALTRFLQRKTDITESAMLKLWKGLYFCFWHSDKAPVQTDLAERLAGIMSSLQEEGASLYFRVFIQTMQREWGTIDRLRLDKYLMLVRKVLAALLSMMAKSSWQADMVESYMAFFTNQILLPEIPSKALGLSYHICDIFIPELQKCLAARQQETGKEADGKLSSATLTALLSPFITVLVKSSEAPLINRVRDGVFEPLIEETRDVGDDSEEEDGGAAQRLPSLLVSLTPDALASHLFELGSATEVRVRNRTALYGISQELEKASKKRAKREQQRPHAKKQDSNASHAQRAATTDMQVDLDTAKQQIVEKAHNDAGAPTSGKKNKKRKAGADAAAAAVNADQRKPDQEEVVVKATPAPAAAAKPAKSALKKAAAADSQHQTKQQQGNAATPGGKSKADSSKNVSANLRSASKKHPANGSAANGQEPSHVHFTGVKANDVEGSLPSTPASNIKGGQGLGADDAAKASTQQQQQDQEQAAATQTKKSVRINLKKNLYFAFGGRVPDPMVRTPPACRSQGGILKRSSAAPGTALKAKSKLQKKGMKEPSSAPAKMVTMRLPAASSGAGGSAQKALPMKKGIVTPKSVKRARAADLF